MLGSEIPHTSENILEVVRTALQIPPGSEKAQIRAAGQKRFQGVHFRTALNERLQSETSLPYELDRAWYTVDTVNGLPGGAEIASLEETIEHPEWVQRQQAPLRTALGFFALMCDRGAHLEEPLIKVNTPTAKEVLWDFSAEYLASAAMLRWPSEKRPGDPAIYFSPEEIADLRMRYPAKHISSSQFLVGLSRLVVRKHLVPGLLDIMYDTTLIAPRAHTLYKQNDFKTDGLVRHRENART